MGELTSVFGTVTECTATVYWDKPTLYEAQYCYRVTVSGETVGFTKKTHFTVSGLRPDTQYRVQIGLCDREKRELAVSSEILICTDKEKKKLNIAQPPYCAAGDGKTLNTAAIQRAIDDCGEGEIVYIPEGIFLTGALRLHSDMELYLEKGAILQGTESPEDYLPRIRSRFEGLETECYSSLLNMGEMNHGGGYPCGNIKIRGEGVISGGGRKLAENIIESERIRLKTYLDSLGDKIREYENADTIPGRVRPRLINISNCRNVCISGLTLQNGPSWNVHMIYSDQIVTHGCTFHSEGVWNGDGWDPDSSENCTIFDCSFFTGDDAIAIKSGKNPEGNAIGRPSRNIRIFDCKIFSWHGIALGSEMSGGIRDIAVWDCDLADSKYGIEIKGTKKRGGYVRNVWVRDCTVSRVMIHSVSYNDDGPGADEAPVFENVRFEKLCILGEAVDSNGKKMPCTAIELQGFDEPGHYLRDIYFSDIQTGKDAAQMIMARYCGKLVITNLV